MSIAYALIRLFRIKKGLRVREVLEIKQCLCRDSGKLVMGHAGLL